MLDEIVKRRLPRSVPTRWNFQSRSVNTVFLYRKQLIECMELILKGEEVKNANSIAQANGYVKTLTSKDFVFWLSLFHEIMPHVDILFGHFQRKDIDHISAVKYVTNFEETITNIRSKIDENMYGIVGSSHTVTNKRKRSDITELKTEAKEVCDTIICQAKERFAFTGHLEVSFLFLSERFSHYQKYFPDEILKRVCNIYTFLNAKQLRCELTTIYSTNEFASVNGAVTLLEFFTENNLENTFSETMKLLKIIITIPMTTSEAERCFSTLKRIKTFLRNTMIEDRLSALAMLSIERQLIMDIPDFNQRVIECFATKKQRRMDFLFK